jgi:hypothetical protein
VAQDPVAIFEVDVALLQALESAFGPPIDSYLMGWQVWLVAVDADDAPEDLELEYRLHPPAGFAQPDSGPDRAWSHHDLWDEVMIQVADGIHPFSLGAEQRELGSLWTLLEAFPAFGEDVTPEQVRGWAEQALQRDALAAGTVDHERLGGGWKRRGHEVDLPAALRSQLGV